MVNNHKIWTAGNLLQFVTKSAVWSISHVLLQKVLVLCENLLPRVELFRNFELKWWLSTKIMTSSSHLLFGCSTAYFGPIIKGTVSLTTRINHGFLSIFDPQWIWVPKPGRALSGFEPRTLQFYHNTLTYYAALPLPLHYFKSNHIMILQGCFDWYRASLNSCIINKNKIMLWNIRS